MNMASSSTVIQNHINNMIKRFTFDELEKFVMPIFPEITWSNLKWNLVNNHYNFTVNNAIRLIEIAIKQENIKVPDLWERLKILEVKDISRHNNKKIWYAYKLLNQHSKGLFEIRNLEESITDHYLEISLEVDVKVAMHQNITFVSVNKISQSKKKRTKAHVKSMQRTVPTFYALFPGQNYLFCSKKDISPNFVKVIANVVGYRKVKTINLVGKSLNSLIRLLRYNEQNTSYAVNLNQPIYKILDPIVKNDGIDYTQTKQRINYMQQCFGEDPPILESFVINGPEKSIQDKDISAILSTDTLPISWEFHSRNVALLLTVLVSKRVFALPLPHYIINLMTLGENRLTLQAN